MTEADQKRKRRRGGTATLWALTAALGVAYLVIWSAIRTPDRLPQEPATVTTRPDALPAATKQVLGDQVAAAAGIRSPGARIQVLSVEEAYLMPGPDLRKAGADVGEPGLIVTVGAVRDGRLVERMVYHALPPDQVVFVSQEPVR